LVGITSEKILKKWNHTVDAKNAEATRKHSATK
jgi:hypothetical protein